MTEAVLNEVAKLNRAASVGMIPLNFATQIQPAVKTGSKLQASSSRPQEPVSTETESDELEEEPDVPIPKTAPVRMASLTLAPGKPNLGSAPSLMQVSSYAKKRRLVKHSEVAA